MFGLLLKSSAISLLMLLASTATATPLLDKRTTCDEYVANTNDAVSCTNYLNGLGQTPCCVNGGGSTQLMCRIGTAAVQVTNGGSGRMCTPCVNIARACGFILDHCTQNLGLGDHTGGSAFAYGNGFLAVHMGNL